jgi:hypothetical protein
MNLSDVEKAAVLLIALGPERAEGILAQLSAADLLPIVDAMKRMRQVPHDVRRSVLLEVNRILHRLSGGSPAGTRSARAEGASDLFRRLGPSLPSRIDPERIDWDDEDPRDGPQWDEPELPSPPRPPGDEP